MTTRQEDGMISYFLHRSKDIDEFVFYMIQCNWTEEEARAEWEEWY